ncbi:MAG: carbamate kinase [Candidatus Micrarchaeota archaeon]
MKIVIALGGNALLRKGERGTDVEQANAAMESIGHLKEVIEKNDTVITHGNGPQVGNLLLQQHATKEVPEMPLHVLVAMTQGQIGFFIEHAIARITKKKSMTIITHCEVDENDSGFKNPTKPIGPFYKEKKPGMVEDAGRGYRLVVACPKVKRILEADTIKKLTGHGKVIIAAGGGGIPISAKGEGLQAVIDKDDASQVLANEIKADVLLFVTAIDAVYSNFGKPNQKRIVK